MRALPAALAAVVLAGLALALAAANVVPGSNAGSSSVPITAQDLAPPECAGLGLTTVVAGSVGTGGNDLLLGSAAGDNLRGNGGVDCIVGGAGNDTLTGNGAGNGDVCIGGPGTDTFKKCQFTYQ